MSPKRYYFRRSVRALGLRLLSWSGALTAGTHSYGGPLRALGNRLASYPREKSDALREPFKEAANEIRAPVEAKAREVKEKADRVRVEATRRAKEVSEKTKEQAEVVKEKTKKSLEDTANDLKERRITKRTTILFFLLVAFWFILFGGIDVLIATQPVLIHSVKSFVSEHGLLGTFIVSFGGSLWFMAFPYEAVIAPFLKAYPIPLFAIGVATIGAVIADSVNFFSGRYLGHEVVRQKVPEKAFLKIEGFLTKWGDLTMIVFGFFGPVTSYDLLAFILGGFSKMRYRFFITVTVAARFIHFSMVFLIADLLIDVVHYLLG